MPSVGAGGACGPSTATVSPAASGPGRAARQPRAPPRPRPPPPARSRPGWAARGRAAPPARERAAGAGAEPRSGRGRGGRHRGRGEQFRAAQHVGRVREALAVELLHRGSAPLRARAPPGRPARRPSSRGGGCRRWCSGCARAIPSSSDRGSSSATWSPSPRSPSLGSSPVTSPTSTVSRAIRPGSRPARRSFCAVSMPARISPSSGVDPPPESCRTSPGRALGADRPRPLRRRRHDAGLPHDLHDPDDGDALGDEEDRVGDPAVRGGRRPAGWRPPRRPGPTRRCPSG